MQLLNRVFGGYTPLGASSGKLTVIHHGLGAYPRLVFFAVFGFFYLLAILYCYGHYYRDPTSAFFDPAHGYDKAYSLHREAEAEAFIQINNVNYSSPRSQRPAVAKPSLCLGIATVARPNTQYIQKTVGSVLQGLTAEERDTLHFVYFIAHSDWADHPIHGQPWTINLPDTLLDYDRSDKQLLEKIKGWEKAGNHRDKGFYDYTHLLNACKNTRAPYIAMLEGDVLAVPGWLGRSVQAAQEVDRVHGWNDDNRSAANKPAWLYIRMFWTETYLGWNSEEWPTYFFWSAVVWLVTTGGLIGVRTMAPRTRPALTNFNIGIVTLVCLPLCIMLYFAAGRMSMRPPPPGIRRMENFGCCSQGMIFRREQVPTIVNAIQRKIEGYMDMLLEKLASTNELERWAIYPSLLQHIGGESSKGDAVADERARMIWNFAFERYGDVLKAGRKLWRA